MFNKATSGPSKRKLFFLLFILFFVFNSKATCINKDSLKSKYDLNDPRNPDCPCHQHQKLADEEYKEWLKKQAREQGVSVSSIDKRDEKRKSKKQWTVFSLKAKRKTKTHPNLHKRWGVKRIKFLKRYTATDACFHW